MPKTVDFVGIYRKFYFFPVFFSLFFSAFAFGCKAKVENVSFYDSHYFKGLEFLKKGEILEAKKSFRLCFDKGSYFCARKSGEELSKIGGRQEREKFCLEFLDKFNDEDALALTCSEFFDNGEFAKVLELSEDCDFLSSLGKLCYFRLCSLIEKKYKNSEENCELWFSSPQITKWHDKFYSEYLIDFVREKDGKISPGENTEKTVGLSFSEEFLELADFRIAVYRGNYKAAYAKIPYIAEKYLKNEAVISQIGKACLYGSQEFSKNAGFFQKIAEKSDLKAVKFYSYFYAGRMFSKIQNRALYAEKSFESAMKNALDGGQFDNAFWYLLDSSLKISTDRAVSMLKKYCFSWDNPEYFDDFFEILTPLLISENKWELFAELYKNLDGCASDETVAKFAWLYARAIQEKFIVLADEKEAQIEISNALNRALLSGKEPYYKIMALNALSSDEKMCEKVLCAEKTNFNFSRNEDAEKFLLGCMESGFPEMIYPEYLNFCDNGISISLEVSVKLSEYLKKNGDLNEKFYPESLRLASKSVLNAEKKLTKQQMKIFYPRDFEKIVVSACEKYNLNEEHLFALIRTESFFDSGIKSSAGAVGLTQLMESTAGDIAKKLKWRNFDLKDSVQNVEMGAFYLAELIRRLDGKVLPAFFSYNAGITKVRRWMENSKIELGYQKTLPLDFFLETIPYEETRGYGRKLVSASVYYAWLYEDKSVCEVVSEIFGR